MLPLWISIGILLIVATVTGWLVIWLRRKNEKYDAVYGPYGGKEGPRPPPGPPAPPRRPEAGATAANYGQQCFCACRTVPSTIGETDERYFPRR